MTTKARLATIIATGLESDVFFDAATFGDHGYQKQIDVARKAMHDAVKLLSSQPLLSRVSKRKILTVADDLLEGAYADIWYDARHYGDTEAEKRISELADAMEEAAHLLEKEANNK